MTALETLRKSSIKELENLYHLGRKVRGEFRNAIADAADIGSVREALTRAKREAARLAQGAK